MENKIDDWEDIPLDSSSSEIDDWEDIPLEEEYVTSEATTPSPNLFTERVMKSLSPDAKVIGGKAGPSLSETLGEWSSELTPKSVKEATSNLAKDLAKRMEGKYMGRLPEESVEAVSKNVDLYKDVAENPGKVAGELSETISEIEKEKFSSNRGTAEALEKDFKPVTKEEFVKDLKKRVSSDIEPPTKKRLAKETKAAEEVKNLKNYTKKAEKYYDKELTTKQKELKKLKNLEVQYKAKNLKARKQIKDMALEEKINLKDKKFALDDELFEYSGDPVASKQIRREKQLLSRQESKLSDNKSRRLAELEAEELSSKEVADSFKKEQSKVTSEIEELKKSKKVQLNELKNRTKEAKELAKRAKIADAPMTKSTKSAMETVENILDRFDDSDLISGKRVEGLRKELSDVYNDEGMERLYKKLRDLIRESSPKASSLLDKATVADSDINILSKYLGLTPEEVTSIVDGKAVTETRYTIPEGDLDSPKKMAHTMTTPKGADEYGNLTPRGMVEEALSKRKGGQDLLQKLELNKAAQLVQNSPAELADAAGVIAQKGKSPATLREFFRGFGTKGQELLAKAAGTDAAKVLGKGAKVLGKTGVVGLDIFNAIQDYEDAEKVLGIESPIGKAAYTLAERFNPSPISAADMSKMAPRKSTAMREAAARMYGLQEKPTKEITTKRLQDRESAQQTVYDLSKLGTGASRDYAARLQNVLDGATTKEEYNRKLGMMATEPGFRKLLKKLRGEEDVDGQEN